MLDDHHILHCIAEGPLLVFIRRKIKWKVRPGMLQCSELGLHAAGGGDPPKLVTYKQGQINWVTSNENIYGAVSFAGHTCTMWTDPGHR